MHLARATNLLKRMLPQLNISCYVLQSSEADALNVFDLQGRPSYDRPLPEALVLKPPIERKKMEDVIINCKRKVYNYHRNQKYDKLKPIPLASKGWTNYKSKGDYFTINIYKDYSINDLYWSKNPKTFELLKIDPDIVDAAKSLGIEIPTIIQEDAIPTILSGKNSLITAETGCGKTMAYLLPMVQQVIKWSQLHSDRPPNTPLAMVLCPSRELAFQIGKLAKTLSYLLPFSCNTIVGGRTKRMMLNPDFRTVDLQIATLGAISKLTTTGLFDVKEVRHLVLDEADSMLDDSFNDHLLRYLKKFQVVFQSPPMPGALPAGCQLTLVSATQPSSLYNVLEEFVELNSLENISSKRLHHVMPHVSQQFHRLSMGQKPVKLLSIAKQAIKNKIPTMIFSNKASTCDFISLTLQENNVPAVNFNGDMPLAVRLGKFKDFREGNVMILSSTDIASRGLDTKHVKQVINYDFPVYMADYIHRCGRTGRCGSPSDCLVINFVSGEREIDLVQKIEMAVRTMKVLPNVNTNITKIIRHKIKQRLELSKQN